MKIITADAESESLESKRPEGRVDWQLVASGGWSDGMYNSGHIEYLIANVGPGEWIMEGVERDACLDDVTEEDVEEGRLNDDQAQAMWGRTLEEAQNSEYRRIVAVCSGANPAAKAATIAARMYEAVCRDGGKEIDEPDEDVDGLLDV